MLTQKAREVLEALQREGLLEQLVLIGSWCSHFYASFFKKGMFEAGIKTQDMDFLIPRPKSLKGKSMSIEEVLKPLDFDPDFTAAGWERFVHPHLRVEFLIPRSGPTSDKPRMVEKLGVMAMPLRHTAALVDNIIRIEREGLRVNVPHPAAFALHKLFVSSRRKEHGKGERDKLAAFRIFDALIQSKITKDVRKIWTTFTVKEQKAIREVLKAEGRENLLEQLGIQ